MIYEKMLQPTYKCESEKSVHLYSSKSVSKEVYDLFWPHFVNFIPSMHHGSVYCIDQFLELTDILELLSDEGIKTAEKCLEHIVNADLLPIAIDGKSCGFTNFKTKD